MTPAGLDRPPEGGSRLGLLVQELLDAHLDTVELGVHPSSDADWQAHLDYVRALHRRGSEVLARLVRDPVQ